MEKITFYNSAGLKLAGVLHRAVDRNESKAVIIAHGFAANKDRERHLRLATVLSDIGINAFRFDFGGCGESDEREITVKAQVDDLRSAFVYLQQEGFEDIGFLGESLGGITALMAFSEDVRALVLWAPVTKAKPPSQLSDEQEQSLKDKGFYVMKKDGRDFKIPQEHVDEKRNIQREAVLGKITVPVLIVHGTGDEIIPIKDSEESVERLPAGSRLETIDNWEDGDHRMDEDMDTIIPVTVKWFKAHL